MSRNSVGPRIRCRFRLSRSSAGSDLSSSKASISRAASFKAVRAASLDGGRRLVRRRLFRRCLAKTFSINEVSERRSRAAAFPAASFRLGSILKVICAVFFWPMIPTLLASQNQRYGSPICSLIPNQFGSGNRYSTLCESDAKRPRNAAQGLADGNPIRTKKSPGCESGLGQEAVGAGVPGSNSSAPFPDSNRAVLSPSAVSSQSGASQPAPHIPASHFSGPGRAGT